MEAQSGIGQGSVRLRLGYRQGLGCAGLRQGSGTGGSVVQGATPTVAVTAVAEAGTQGFAGRENVKWRNGHPPPPPPPPPPPRFK